MSFYSDASLALIPSGYKNGKVYCAVPTDGSADLAFSRASNATRVASNGLIEKVRTNVVPFSEQFDNAAWVKQNITISPNTQTAPDGTLSADKIIVNNGVAFSSISNYCRTAALTLTTGVVYTVSVYAKADGFDVLLARISTATGMGAAPTLSLAINLTTGLQTGGTIGTYIGREAAANGYYRYIFQTSAIASATNYLSFVPSDTTATEGNGVDGISIWGAMAEIGDIATDYIATTTTAVSVGPVSGLPRLDYLNSTCPRLLLEPQRTNLVTFSEQFDNAAWTKGGATISANTSATLDPSGYNGSDKLVEDSSTGAHRVFNNSAVTISDSVATTYSVFAKAAERTQIYLRDNDIVGARFNLSTGAVISTEGTATATITNYGNGWYRCTITRVSATTSGRVAVYLDNGGDSYTGNGTSGVYIFGAQIETSATYASSYLNTLSTSVTRVADAASKTGVSSLIGQTEGTMFVEVNLSRVDTSPVFTISDGTDLNRIQISFLSSTELFATIRVSGVNHNLGVTVPSVPSTGGSYKIGLGYKANDFCFSLNGTNYISTATRPVPTCSVVSVGTSATATSFLGDRVTQALLFKTRLSNSDLAALTTL